MLLEHIDGKLDLLAEGNKNLDEKIDRTHEKLSSEIGGLHQEMNYKFEVAFEKFKEVDERFDKVDGEIHIIRNELKEKVGRDEFQLLEKRGMALERKGAKK
ncbi:MAG: hypothetical protein NUV53_00660 [Patescibacteria group bacterium]|nr:hypothetical protein [Patescibacteria group bacterium]